MLRQSPWDMMGFWNVSLNGRLTYLWPRDSGWGLESLTPVLNLKCYRCLELTTHQPFTIQLLR